ncbi:MAG: GPW/gp25 family protein, partial [Betaproteobacteria bacterium]
ILMTEPGERLRLPEFGAGLGRFLFEPNILATHTLMRQRIADALKRWEPRVQVEEVDVQADAIDPQAAIATITYRLVATQALERVALAVSVGSGGS